MFSADWSYPTAIKFGAGRLRELGQLCQTLAIHNPLLVTDPGIAVLGLLEKAQQSLQQAGCAFGTFAEVRPDPDERNLQAGLLAFRSAEHDAVVALGGGSALDLGKAIAFMEGQQRPIGDFEDIGENWKRADATAIRPCIAIPTTSGTGSEASRVSVITHSASASKKLIFHPKMMPTAVILDPELTLALPAPLTAQTGMDALSHNVEAFCGGYPHPLADGIALEGVRLIKEHLQTAFADGANLKARGYMQIASMMGAVAFQRGLGAVHALSHPIGTLYHVHHGLINAVLMPFVLSWNRAEIEEKIIQLARHAGIAGGFDGFLSWLIDLRMALGIPQQLSALGVKRTDLHKIAEMSVLDPTARANPRPYALEGALEILEAAI